MALIARDLMVGNPRLAELGFGEEALGHNAIARRLPGPAPVDRPLPQRRLPGGDPQLVASTGTASAQPYIFATENDCLNGASMLFGHLLTNTAQIFADVRTYWSPEAVKRVTGYKLDGPRRRRLHPPDQLRRGHAGRHRRDDRRRRQAGDEALLGDHRRTRSRRAWRPRPGTRPTAATSAAAASPAELPHPRRHAGHDGAPQPGQGPRARCCRSPRAGRWTCPTRSTTSWTSAPTPPGRRTGSCRALTGSGPFRDVYTVMANWGANHGAISYGHIGADLISLASMLRIPVCMHNVPEEDIFRPERLGRLRHADPRGRRLPRLRQLRPAVRAQVAPTSAPPPRAPPRHRRGGGLIVRPTEPVTPSPRRRADAGRRSSAG